MTDRGMRRASTILLAAAALWAIAAVGQPGGKRDAALPAIDWPLHGLTADEQRFAPIDQINRDTVARLGVAWWAEFDTDRGQEATPIEVGGVLYTTTAWSKVYAFDARTGRKLWEYDPKVPGQTALAACCDLVNRGPAVWQGKVYAGTLDGRLIALDAKSGRRLWEVQTTERSLPYTITGAPKVINGKVVIGNGGAEYAVRGYVSAYDALTGKQAWRFYLAPNPDRRPDHAASDEVFRRFANATWSPGQWPQAGGGGTAWDSLTYDEKNDLLLIGAGNGGPWNRDIRSGGKGDNLFISSIVAVRPQTGQYVWHYQTTPGDRWDYTATQHIMLADLTMDGCVRRVVMQAPKNGFFYVLDAKSGKLISAEKYIPADWADKVDLVTGRPVESAIADYVTGRPTTILPSPLGGHNWHPMAYSPQTGLVYIPALHAKGSYQQPDDIKAAKFEPGVGNRGVAVTPFRTLSQVTAWKPNKEIYGELIAWDPVAAKARWRLRFDQYWRSGVLATAGGLVFHAVGRDFTAFDAASGKVLWTYDTLSPAIAPPISYRLDGQQYVALMVGWGGAGAIGGLGVYPRNAGRLLVFKLGGAVRPDPFPDVALPEPLDLTLATTSTGNADRGRASYLNYCQGCHRNNRFLPNLVRSPAILEPEGFRAVVIDGVLADRGMPTFARYLNGSQAEDLRAFFLTQAALNGPVENRTVVEH